MSHRIQNKLYPTADLQKESFTFLSKSINNTKLFGNSNDFIAAQFYFHGYFEWRNIVLMKAVSQIFDGVCLEIGANIGTETLSYSKFFEKGVFAFEPEPKNFLKLKETKDINNLVNLKIFQLGVSDKEENLEFKVSEASNSGTGYFSKHSGDMNLKLIKLDDFFKDRLGSCAGMVIDVEGFELKVLKGASEIINEFQPVIILEVNPSLMKERADEGLEELVAFFDKKEYVYRQISALNLKKLNIENFKKQTHVNWIAIPNTKEFLFRKFSRLLWMNAFNPFFKKFIF
ncbi:hypothetical protein GRFL_2406 [Christiangramia flava JLT2011]|uniref:Methyltransferase FkbM domain-containing protein n=1 Tax=Christiangramia flava JLT2011 TaxID=1229726 RepID=A0A1L7I6A8_9FLAO|nr:hypothetical protein GRFL_2406 [Christiangramia flava JLT2011]